MRIVLRIPRTVNAGLQSLAAGAAVVFLQLVCGPWSAVRFNVTAPNDPTEANIRYQYS